MMNSSIVTIKGQIVIPVALRRKVGLRKGTRVFLEEKKGDIIIHPLTPEFYDRMCGILKGSGLVKALEEDRRREKEREDRRLGKN